MMFRLLSASTPLFAAVLSLLTSIHGLPQIIPSPVPPQSSAATLQRQPSFLFGSTNTTNAGPDATHISTNFTLPINASLSGSNDSTSDFSPNSLSFDSNILSAYKHMLALHPMAKLTNIRATKARWTPSVLDPVRRPEELVTIELWYWIGSRDWWIQSSIPSHFGAWGPPQFHDREGERWGSFTLEDLRFGTQDALRIAESAAERSIATHGLKRIWIRTDDNDAWLARRVPYWFIAIGDRQVSIDGQTGQVERVLSVNVESEDGQNGDSNGSDVDDGDNGPWGSSSTASSAVPVS